MFAALARLFRFSAAAPVAGAARACVFSRGGRLLVAAEDRTADGFWLTGSHVTVLAAGAGAAPLGAAVQAALAASRTGVTTPARDGGPPPDAPLWRAAGVRSRRAFMAGARLCTVNCDGGSLTVRSTVSGGPTGTGAGWQPRADAAPRALPAAAAPDALGDAVLAALAESAPWPATLGAV